MRSMTLLLGLIAVLLSSGCALNLNSVESVSTAIQLGMDRAIVVYGVAVEENWGAPRFSVALDEYSVTQQKITGNCWRFNRMEASIPGTPGPIQYFAFEVPPGHFAYSGFSGVPLEGTPVAFVVPKNKIVYVGVFIYTQERKVILQRDFAAERSRISDALPEIKGHLVLAESLPVRSPGMFMCGP